MKSLLGRFGWDGIVALAAFALASGVIAYRLVGDAGDAGVAVPGAASSTDSIAELERRANAEPGNARAWQELGFARFERGRFADAATAYERATEADPDSAVLWSSLGEALVMASERDPMPQRARQAFRKAAALDTQDPRARYFLAVEKDLAGDHEGALADWLALLADTPPGAPWEADLKRTIEQVGQINNIAVEQRLADAAQSQPVASVPPLVATQGIPGPTQEQIAAAASLRPSEQQQMAEGMVARLEARLAADPGDVDGWIMLMRSRIVLRQPGRATVALRSALAANPSRQEELLAAARQLGVAS